MSHKHTELLEQLNQLFADQIEARAKLKHIDREIIKTLFLIDSTRAYLFWEYRSMAEFLDSITDKISRSYFYHQSSEFRQTGGVK